MQTQIETLIEKLENLSPDRIAEVTDFIEFLQQKDEQKRLRNDFSSVSERPFARIWDNDDDAAYDAL